MTAHIKQITLTWGDQTLTLTLEEAQAIRAELNRVLADGAWRYDLPGKLIPRDDPRLPSYVEPTWIPPISPTRNPPQIDPTKIICESQAIIFPE